MRFSTKQVIFLTISLGHVLDVTTRAVPNTKEVSTLSLNARAGICCEETAPPPEAPPVAPRPITTQPGLGDPPEAPTVPKAPTPKAPAPAPEEPAPAGPEEEPPADPSLDNPVTSEVTIPASKPGIPPKLTQPIALAKGQRLLAGKTTLKTFAPYKNNYKTGAKKIDHLTGPSQTFLKFPLSGQPNSVSAEFDQLELFSKKAPPKRPDKQITTLRAGFSSDGISVDFMDKSEDGTDAANKVPTSALLLQGAAQKKSVPTFVYMKKISNFDTLDFIRYALKDPKDPSGPSETGDLTLTNSADNPTQQEWFVTLVGSDNGRPVQQMAAAMKPPKTISSIYINKKSENKIVFMLSPAETESSQ